MKKITDKDVEALKAGKKVTKGFIHMQLDDKGKLNLWSDINITDNYRSLKIDANKLFDHGILSKELPVDKFYKNKSQKDGFGYYCKDCVNAYKSSKKANADGGG